MGLMRPRFLFTCFEILQVEEIMLFEIFTRCKSIDMYTALPVLLTCLRGNSEISF